MAASHFSSVQPSQNTMRYRSACASYAICCSVYSVVGAHASGYNSHSIGVCYIGGLDARTGKGKDTRTLEQKVALERLVRGLLARYPGSRVVGHRDLSPDRNHDGKITPNEWTKSCPCFEAQFIIKDPLPSSPC